MGNEQLSDTEIPTRRVGTVGATRRKGGEFLRGPIPLTWIGAASRTGDPAAIQAALAIWWEAGRTRSRSVRLTSAILARFQAPGDPRRKARGLRVLEDAGLVIVERQSGKNPGVTISMEELT